MAQQAQSKASKQGGGRKVTLLVLLLPIIMVLLPTTVLMVVAMAPTIVAYITDRSGGKYLAVAVGLLNFCGSLPAVANLWSMGQSFDNAINVLSDPISWFIAYGAAAIGWMVFSMLPPIMTTYYVAATRTRIQVLKRKQKELIDIWGQSVVGEEQHADEN